MFENWLTYMYFCLCLIYTTMQKSSLVKWFTLFGFPGDSGTFLLATYIWLHYIVHVYKNKVKLAIFKISYRKLDADEYCLCVSCSWHSKMSSSGCGEPFLICNFSKTGLILTKLTIEFLFFFAKNMIKLIVKNAKAGASKKLMECIGNRLNRTQIRLRSFELAIYHYSNH